MVKQTWNIDLEERNRIIEMHEKATKSLYLLNEQPTNVATIVGKTDASRISHDFLGRFGLPDGKKHENYYYSTDIKRLYEIAKTEDESKYLSIFTPASPYDRKETAYIDYVQFGSNPQESLKNQGSKVFKVNDGIVYAAHNGLLALKRVIEGMNKEKINQIVPIKIIFGTSTGEKAGERSERGYEMMRLQVEKIENQSSVILGFQNQMSLLAIKDYKNTKLYANFDKPKEILVNVVKNWFPRDVIGLGTFLDEKNKDEVIQNLSKKGYITSLKTDLNGPISKLLELSKIDDVYYPGDYGSGKGEVNPEKLKKVTEIGKSYQDSLFNEYKQSYINNLKLFVENYLPENIEVLNSIIPKIYVPIVPLERQFSNLFTNVFAGQAPSTNAQFEKKSKKSDIGN